MPCCHITLPKNNIWPDLLQSLAEDVPQSVERRIRTLVQTVVEVASEASDVHVVLWTLDSALRDLRAHPPAADLDLEDQLDIVYGDLERLEVAVAALRTGKARGV